MSLIDNDQFTDHGLYLLMGDGTRLDLTRPEIERRMRRLLDDPAAIPAELRAAADYRPCAICPERFRSEICHAIMTTLPFASEIDRYASYDNVTAVYRELPNGKHPGGLYIRVTSMQEALRFMATLSLMYYCEVGQKYYPYFANVNPLMPHGAIVRTVLMNLYLAFAGDRQKIEALLIMMERELLETAQCQVRRLRLVSKQDAFINAITTMHNTTRLVLMELQALFGQLST